MQAVMDGSDPVQLMASICQERSRTWQALTDLTDPSDPRWAGDLSGRLETLSASTQWLLETWQPGGVLLLEGLVRRLRRRGEADLADLAGEAAVAAQPALGRLHRSVAALSRLCAAELDLWESGDSDGAKALRVEQMALLVPGSQIRDEARRLSEARLPVWSPVAQAVSAYLTLETGR